MTGDLGYMALEPFIEEFPARFFNMGVAEQNMVGVATGLAEAGFLPFVYSINPFAVLRPYEFIRNGPIAHRLPVRVVGVGGGFEYGPQGQTHHGLEDLAVMRANPGIVVIAPADHLQTVTAVRATWQHEGPVYYRLGKDDRVTVPGLGGRFTTGGAEQIRAGRDVVLVATGSVAVEVARAVDQLVAGGVDAGFVVVASVHPAPVADLADALRATPLCLTVEAHYAAGGLGSLVAEVIAERRLGGRLVRCGVRAPAGGVSGSQPFMHARHGISAEALGATVRDALGQIA